MCYGLKSQSSFPIPFFIPLLWPSPIATSPHASTLRQICVLPTDFTLVFLILLEEFEEKVEECGKHECVPIENCAK